MKNTNMRHEFSQADGMKKFPWEVVSLWTQKIGRTNLMIFSIFAGIGLIIPAQFIGSLQFTLESLVSIAPFLIISVAMAAYLKAAGADQVIGKVFSGHLILMIITASVFGALSPFCSCGVIPLIAALLASGVPLSAVMAFWISSPVMSPDMFVLTAGALGGEFAVAKTLGTIGVGLLGGFATLGLQHFGGFKNPLRVARKSGCGASAAPVNNQGKPVWKFWHEMERKEVFLKEFKKTSIFLGQWLIFAFALESLMVVYLPAEVISQWITTDSLAVIPLAALVGIPAYLNGYAAIPVAAGLLESGFEAGAVLSFMTAGAMTSIPAAIAVFSLVKKHVFFWYIALSLGGSILVGFAYQGYLAVGI